MSPVDSWKVVCIALKQFHHRISAAATAALDGRSQSGLRQLRVCGVVTLILQHSPAFKHDGDMQQTERFVVPTALRCPLFIFTKCELTAFLFLLRFHSFLLVYLHTQCIHVLQVVVYPPVFWSYGA